MKGLTAGGVAGHSATEIPVGAETTTSSPGLRWKQDSDRAQGLSRHEVRGGLSCSLNR